MHRTERELYGSARHSRKKSYYQKGTDTMLLEDEALVVQWLSQYGALQKIQLARLL